LNANDLPLLLTELLTKLRSLLFCLHFGLLLLVTLLLQLIDLHLQLPRLLLTPQLRRSQPLLLVLPKALGTEVHSTDPASELQGVTRVRCVTGKRAHMHKQQDLRTAERVLHEHRQPGVSERNKRLLLGDRLDDVREFAEAAIDGLRLRKELAATIGTAFLHILATRQVDEHKPTAT